MEELARAAQWLDFSKVANRGTLELLYRPHPVGDGMPSLLAEELERLDAAVIDLQREHTLIAALLTPSAPRANYWQWDYVKFLHHCSIPKIVRKIKIKE